MLRWQMQKGLILAALSLAALCGGGAAFAQEKSIELEYVALGEMAARYCELEQCSLDLPPSAMSYAIIKPYYKSENKTYLEAQLKAYGLQNNYTCGISRATVYCTPKKAEVSIIDSSRALWNVQKIPREDLDIYRQVIAHNKTLDTIVAIIDTSTYKPWRSKYVMTIKVRIVITEFDLGYKVVKASYINDYYSADFYRFLKYGSTVKEIATTQRAENGTSTSSYTDKLQGLQVQGDSLTITANNRDLTTPLFGGVQTILQTRKECGLDWFGLSLFCGLVQTEIAISLE